MYNFDLLWIIKRSMFSLERVVFSAANHCFIICSDITLSRTTVLNQWHEDKQRPPDANMWSRWSCECRFFLFRAHSQSRPIQMEAWGPRVAQMLPHSGPVCGQVRNVERNWENLRNFFFFFGGKTNHECNTFGCLATRDPQCTSCCVEELELLVQIL